MRDAINMANGAGQVEAVKQCDKSDDANISNDTVTHVSRANATHPNKDKSTEGKKKIIEALKDKLSVGPITVADPPRTNSKGSESNEFVLLGLLMLSSLTVHL